MTISPTAPGMTGRTVARIAGLAPPIDGPVIIFAFSFGLVQPSGILFKRWTR